MLHGHVQVIESACFSSSASKTVYISKLAKHVSAAKTCEGVEALLHSAGATVQSTPAMLSEIRSAAAVNNVDPNVQHSCNAATKDNSISMMPETEMQSHLQKPSESSAGDGGRIAPGAPEECQEEATKLHEMLRAAAQKRQREMMDAGGLYAGPYAGLR